MALRVRCALCGITYRGGESHKCASAAPAVSNTVINTVVNEQSDTVVNASTARFRRWIVANREKRNNYMRDYMRKYREAARS